MADIIPFDTKQPPDYSPIKIGNTGGGDGGGSMEDRIKALEITTQHIQDDVRGMRTDLKEFRSEVKDEIKEFRSEMRDDMKELRSEMRDDMKEFRSEMRSIRSDMNALRSEMNIDFKWMVKIMLALLALSATAIGLLVKIGFFS